MLSHRRQDVNGQPGGLREIHGHELNRAVQQAGNEMHVTGQTVQLGDDERGLPLLAGGQGRRQFRAIRPLPAFDFGIFPDQLPRAAVQILADGPFLSFQP
jgi:hypothetical protein